MSRQSRQRHFLQKIAAGLDREINELETRAAEVKHDRKANETCHQTMMILQNIKRQIVYSLNAVPK